MRRSRATDRYSIRAVERAIKVLDCFSFQQREYTMGELAQLTNLSKPTVFRILQTLQNHRYVSYDFQLNRYSLGIKLFELGGIVSSSLSLRRAASRFLDLLETKVNVAVLMGILEGGELMIIDKREGKDDSGILTLEIGRKKPPHFGMLGKTLMAFLDEEEVNDLLHRYPLRKAASKSITTPEKFKRKLREIREKGYSYGSSESIEGVTGIGAPIRNHLGEVVAAVGTAFPTFGMNDRKIERTIQLVTETAKEISSALGFRDIAEEGREKRYPIETRTVG